MSDVKLSVLGNLDLAAGDGGDADALMAQPKRFGLFCYLAIPKPGTMFRRDTILGVFWPEGDSEHTRSALRQALRYLRKKLGDDVLVRRGAEEVGLDPQLVWCDVAVFERELDQGRLENAVKLYRGELLKGFFLTRMPEFERWLDGERVRLASRQAKALEDLACSAAAEGRTRDAVEWWEALVHHDPFDSRYATGLMGALDRAGDPANALLYARKHRELLRTEFNITLPPVVKALENHVREGHGVRSTDPLAPEAGKVDAAESTSDDFEREVTADGDSGSNVPEPPPNPRRHFARLIFRTAVLTAVAALTFAAGATLRNGRPRLDGNKVVVAPLRNLSGDPSLDELGYLAADWIGQSVLQIGVVDVVPAAFARFLSEADPGGRDVRAIAERTGAGLAVCGAIERDRDSIRYHVELIDVAGGRSFQSFDEVSSGDRPREAIDLIAQRVSGALAAETDPYMARMLRSMPRPPKLAAYREHRLGYHFFDIGDKHEALRHQLAAYELDTTFLRPIVAAGFAASDPAQRDSLARFANNRRHLLSRAGNFDLDILLGMIEGTWQVALQAAEGLVQVEGGYAHVVEAALANRTNQPRRALATLSRYDPNPEWRRDEADSYWEVLLDAQHMLGRHDRELAAAREARDRYPNRLDMLNLEVRALAALGGVADIEELFDRAAALSSHNGISHWMLFFTAGLELREHGHSQLEANKAFARSAIWLQERLPVAVEYEQHLYALAKSHYWLGNYRNAYELFDRLVTQFPESRDSIEYLGSLGAAAARIDDRPLAARIGEQLSLSPNPHLLGKSVLWQARILAVLGDSDTAMQRLQQAFREGVAFGVWLRADWDLESLHARADFQELVRPKG